MNNSQIQKKFALQVNQIVERLKKFKVSAYVLFLSLILLLCSFIHIPYNNSGVEGILGFKWMTSFLFAIALPLTQISSGLLIKFLSGIVKEEFKGYFNGLSNLVLATGFFFLLWTLVPYDIKKQFKSHHYYILVAALSIGMCFIAHHIHKAVMLFERKMTKQIKILFKYIYSLNTTNVIKEEKEEEFATSIIEVTDAVILGKNERERT